MKFTFCNIIKLYSIFSKISKSLFPRYVHRFGAGLSYEDYEAIARHKLERQGSTNTSRCMRKYPPGMTYEEIASSRSAGIKRQESKIEEDDSPDRDSQESIEPLQEKDLKATGPDPFDKLNYRTGEQPRNSIIINKKKWNVHS